MPPSPDKKFWFPAKRYGWGWGLPCCWQGWVVFLCFLLTLGLSALFLLPRHPLIWEGVVWGSALILIAVCWWKGEKPRWRWGNK